jgi:hypothetical protein
MLDVNTRTKAVTLIVIMAVVFGLAAAYSL